MLFFCDFIQVYVFTTNHHLKFLNAICFAWNDALGRARKVKTGSVCATAQADHCASPFISQMR